MAKGKTYRPKKKLTFIDIVKGNFLNREEIKVHYKYFLLLFLLMMMMIYSQRVQLLFNGIGSMHLPDKLVSVLFLSWRYAFLIWEKLSQTHKALHSRLFQGGMKLRTYQTYGEIIGGLFVKSIDGSDRVYKAMISRGYTGRSVVAEAQKITALDVVKSMAMLISVAALYFI